MGAKNLVRFGQGSAVRHLLLTGSGAKQRFELEHGEPNETESSFDRVAFLADRGTTSPKTLLRFDWPDRQSSIKIEQDGKIATVRVELRSFIVADANPHLDFPFQLVFRLKASKSQTSVFVDNIKYVVGRTLRTLKKLK